MEYMPMAWVISAYLPFLKSSSRYDLSFSFFSMSETRTSSAMTKYLLGIDCRTLSQRGDFIATASPRQEEFHPETGQARNSSGSAILHCFLEKVRRFR